MDVAGSPAGDRLLERYAAASGLDLSPLPRSLGFTFYKIAAIFEGTHCRHLQGLTVGEGFDLLGALVPALVEGPRCVTVADLSPRPSPAR